MKIYEDVWTENFEHSERIQKQKFFQNHLQVSLQNYHKLNQIFKSPQQF